MKKLFKHALLLGSIMFLFSSCCVSYINTDTLMENYEKKINHTTLPGKVLFKTDQRKKDTYENVQVFLNERKGLSRPCRCLEDFKIHVFHTGKVCVSPYLPFGGEDCSLLKASGLFEKKENRL